MTLEGDLLKAWRLGEGMTQEALGHACDPEVPKQRVGEIENSLHRPTIPTLLRLVRGLGVPGADDGSRLARFFQGPDGDPVEESAKATEKKAQATLALLRQRERTKAR